MSHMMAARCREHDVILTNYEGCPERGCSDTGTPHGVTTVECPGSGSCPAVPITVTFVPSGTLTRETFEAAVESVRTATYSPPVSLHHPSCPNVQPGRRFEDFDWSQCTPGCAP